MARMEPAMRDYLTKMREQAFIDIKPGFTDTGASAKQTKPIYSAYTPPAPKKKKKVERTRFRETRAPSGRNRAASCRAPAEAPAAAPRRPAKRQEEASADLAPMKPGKKEKIRLARRRPRPCPVRRKPTEDAGACRADRELPARSR
jgi:peptidyl-prolyl cis-trans isomerase SurA